ncbi:ceramide glucosyltransferase [Plectosphaerella plurivora]|uniref:Ceramide glucosyltransferase n=1 Tax=Plectosphaerella plurivora TaxID=936078 RepID=A0A9P8VI16_9PEZI|nr:ceramide glucosyltransferase [Plectosphaerella plurivora]
MSNTALLIQLAAYVSAIWSITVFFVQVIGNFQIFTRYSSRPKSPVSSSLPVGEAPHVTIIRPVKGVEPNLYECIASTFRQNYPRDKLSICLCVAEKSDPAYPLLLKIVQDFPEIDARVLVESDDPFLNGLNRPAAVLGPNPKIRNISRAYREAKGDIIWVIDCNVWVGPGTGGRMVDKLVGLGPAGKHEVPYKFVHQLPISTETETLWEPTPESRSLLSPSLPGKASEASGSRGHSLIGRIMRHGGGRLDEMFMGTAHAKFYSAINTVGVAPCAVGKSNMFRKSHLEIATDPARNPGLNIRHESPGGLDYFSNFICEDHLISDILWKSDLPGFRNHALVYGDLAIQPMAGFSVQAYVARRARWLRARKWTVLAATLVEPGTESLLCCLHVAFALTTIPWVHETFGMPQTWSAMGLTWLATVALWMFGDWNTYNHLHSGQSIDLDDQAPKFARGTANADGAARRTFFEWLPAWLGRETLALPIWTWAVLLGSTVDWRGQTFKVRMDMSVVALDAKKPGVSGSRSSGVDSPSGDARSRSKSGRV